MVRLRIGQVAGGSIAAGLATWLAFTVCVTPVTVSVAVPRTLPTAVSWPLLSVKRCSV
jgi:hypothetical protein